jgi:hypothetical protein
MAHDPLENVLIDYAVFSSMRFSQKVNLVKAALGQISADGVKAAMIMHSSYVSPMVLLACGFVPLPSEFYTVFLLMNSKLSLKNTNKTFIYWR